MRVRWRTAAFLAIFPVVLWAGCRTTLMISNRPDPEDFPPFLFAGTSGSYYGEISFDVPEEAREQEYDVESAYIYCEVWADTIYAEGEFVLEVDLYLGLTGGEADLDDTGRNEYLTTVEITARDEHRYLKLSDPRLIGAALRREQFFVKGLVRLQSDGLAAGRVRIDRVYFDAYLSRDTSGLLPLLYLF